MTRCKPWEGGNDKSVITTTGCIAMGRWKPHMQTTRCANHGRVEVNFHFSGDNFSGGWKPHMQTTGVVTMGGLKQNINIFLESKLSQHDKSIDYQINNCIIIRADEKNTINPHCGIISYINSSLKITHFCYIFCNSIQNMSTEIIDTLYMNISHKNKHISIFTIYNSPKNTYTNLINHLLPKIDNEYLINILSSSVNFNIQQHTNDYLQLSSKLAKYNIKQYIHNYTTINNTTIDYVFTNMQINKINILYAHCSDHNIIQLQIDT